ncbi:MAG TPA: U32 family peptidase [Candidatus Onthocola stercoravium]|nr:U32 family peptidase [Candidatus Onthocola stercoravium]
MERINKLVTVTNREIIDDLRNIPNVTLVYPLKSFCVGFTDYFDILEIDDYVLVNRILDDNDLDKLESILNSSNIKGIVFDDLGIIDIVANLDITKILLLDHLATNTKSINYYLEYVDSVVVSNDLTEEEIRIIVANVSKPLVINVFGLKTLMYSRRLLLSNYEMYHNLKEERIVDASIEDKYFKIVENDYGTLFYAKNYYNALCLLDLDNVLFFWYNPIFLDNEKIIKLVLDNDITDINSEPLFLDKKTYYKVGDIDA